ncbi:hypothetical protein HDU67_006537 [Dinochytrium kinnereticum]|nr:hypothetical protein HDU67_006537 [Dinochytrium kinnereticum]
MQRERRANAGSRMRKLIEEQLASSASFQEEEDDGDFQAAEEEDVVDSDFESTDEDEPVDNQAVEEADDGSVEARRLAKRAKVIAAQTGRHKGFIPPAHKPRASFSLQNTNRVGPSTIVVTTGQGPNKIDDKEKERAQFMSISPARRSYRASTMYNKLLLDQKLERNRRRQVTTTMKRKINHDVQLTQRQLLEEAVQVTEPLNINCLEEMRARDEEKRRQSKVIKPRLPSGPIITFISMRSDRHKPPEAADPLEASLPKSQKPFKLAIAEPDRVEGMRSNKTH